MQSYELQQDFDDMPLLSPPQCSVTCGRGTKEREIACVLRNQTKVEEEHCSPLPRPRAQKACRARGCPSWKANKWREVCLLFSQNSRDNSNGCEQLRHKHKHGGRLPRGFRCRTCTHRAPVQSPRSLFLFKHNVSFPLSGH